jgi:hypothetical protein
MIEDAPESFEFSGEYLKKYNIQITTMKTLWGVLVLEYLTMVF